MCELCERDPRALKVARDNTAYQAQRLRSLAARLDDLANGQIRPHTDAAKQIGEDALPIIRFLVMDWL